MEYQKLNKYQTQITEELIESLPKEISDNLLECITTIPFIKSLISDKRERAKDRPRDAEGKIIVDLANPHILENMEYFQEAALYYKKHGVYNKARPNANVNSEYGKWIRQERDRCWNGMIRPEDGEWIPGALYFYINYCPIIQSKIRKGTKQADRIVDFPEMWEGIYWRFHYMHQARNGGLYNDFMGSNHGAELASRGKAFAYSQDVETPEGLKKWADIKIGDTLFDPFKGTTKVIDIPFDEESDVYKMTLKDGREIYTTLEHLWKINKNGSNWDKLYTTEDIMNSKQINRFAIEASAGVDYLNVDVPIPPYLLGIMLGDGSFTISKYNQAQFCSRQEDVLTYQNVLGIKFQLVNSKNKDTNWLIPYDKFGTKAKLLGLNLSVSDTKFIPNIYKYNSREVRLAVLKGLLDTDGSVHDSGKPEFYTTSKQMAKDVLWLARSLGYNASQWIKKPKYKHNDIIKQGKDCYIVYIHTNDILFNLPRKIKLQNSNGARNQSKILKTSIKSIEYSHREMCKCVTVDRQDGLFLIGDFLTTHNSKSYSMASILTRNFVLGENKEAWKETRSIVTAYQKEYLIKDGVLNKFVSMADFVAQHTQFPRKRLKSALQDMNWVMGYKDAELNIEKGTQNQVLGVSSKDDESKLRGKRAIFIGIEEFGTFARLIDLYNVLIPSVQEGDYVFGLMYLQGTAGDNESDFAGAQEIMYNPVGYNMYALPNVYDKLNQGKKQFVFFYPGYVNRKGFYDENGVSDVIGALISILKERYRVKYNSTDPNTIIKTIAEVPITPAEAIIKTGVNLFPVIDLTERLNQLDNNPREFDDVYTGDLIIDKSGQIQYKNTSKNPIRTFKGQDNQMEGAVEIFQMPEKDNSGKVFINRYILSCDPYDNDQANSKSLGSIFVLDLWTDRIVAEYTGRPLFADDFYEIARRMCLFFNGRMNYENNKKGLFAYFQKMNSLYLLTDTLEFLKDKDMVKSRLFGNNTKGTTATEGINSYARTLLRNWLLRPITMLKKYQDEEEEIVVARLFTLRTRALIEELISYNDVGNFDRVSSMMMLMLLREDRMVRYNGNLLASREEDGDKNYLGNDPFFERNYRFQSHYNK